MASAQQPPPSAAPADPSKPPAGQPKVDESKLSQSVTAARKVVAAQTAAASLKEQAMNAVNPKERFKYLQEAYTKEVEAFGQSKWAKTLQSGAFQGAVGGGGIGAAVSMGLGAVVGTLVSGLTAIPTMAVGGLVGVGAGLIKGPFVKFGGGEKKKEMTEAEKNEAIKQEAKTLDDAVEKGAMHEPRPPRLSQVEREMAGDALAQTQQTSTPAEKRRPRKLQVRSGNEMPTPPASPAERRKPAKLQTRSKAMGVENS